MDRMFSMDEIDIYQLWSPDPQLGLGGGGGGGGDEAASWLHSSAATADQSTPIGMNRSSSELAFQQFLQEAAPTTTIQSSSLSNHHNNDDDIVEIDGVGFYANQQQLNSAAGVPPPDSEEYRAFLKSRLELECAAAASIRGKASAAPHNGSQSSNSLQLVADSTKLQDYDGDVPPPPPVATKKYGKATTSGLESIENQLGGGGGDADEAAAFWLRSPVATADQSTLIGMNRGASELALEQFLQEAAATSTIQSLSTHQNNDNDVVEINGSHHHFTRQCGDRHPHTQIVGVDSSSQEFLPHFTSGVGVGVHANQQSVAAGVPPPDSEVRAFLKSRLELECAAVASIRGKGKASAAPHNGSQSSNSLQLVDSTKDGEVPVDVPPPPPPVAAISKKCGGSSAKRENESTQNVDPTEAKLAKKKLANRESARRSRTRKQAQHTEQEARVARLRLDNAALRKRVNDLIQKEGSEALSNTLLKSRCETLVAKVKTSEVLVKKVAGLDPSRLF